MLGCACLTKNCCRRHTQGGQQFGWVCTKAELLICMPWAFPGSCVKSGNTSAWEFRIHICPMPPHCSISCSSAVFPKLLCNISITFLSFLRRQSFYILMHPSCTLRIFWCDWQPKTAQITAQGSPWELAAQRTVSRATANFFPSGMHGTN